MSFFKDTVFSILRRELEFSELKSD